MDDDPVPRSFKGHFYKCVRCFKTNFLDITAIADETQNKNVSAYNSIFPRFFKSKSGNREFFVSKNFTTERGFSFDCIHVSLTLLFTFVNAERKVAKF